MPWSSLQVEVLVTDVGVEVCDFAGASHVMHSRVISVDKYICELVCIISLTVLTESLE